MLHKTKNNSVGRPQEVDFPRLEGESACPSAAIEEFLGFRGSSESKEPLFIDEFGRAIGPERFNDKLKSMMAIIEPSLKGRFTSKSFRIGITSDAFALGVSEVDMGNLGRWALARIQSVHVLRGLTRARRKGGGCSATSVPKGTLNREGFASELGSG